MDLMREIGIEEEVLNVVYDFWEKGASKTRDIGRKHRAFRNLDAVQKLRDACETKKHKKKNH